MFIARMKSNERNDFLPLDWKIFVIDKQLILPLCKEQALHFLKNYRTTGAVNRDGI